MVRLYVIFALAAVTDAVSPVQKVVELLDECKAKVAKDLAAEASAMEEYTTFCDDELKEKAYAIATAERQKADRSAIIADAQATIAQQGDEISTLGSVMAAKNQELYVATKDRKEDHGNFVAAEKELVESADQLARAAQLVKRGMSLAQQQGATTNLAKTLAPMTTALSAIIEAQWVGSRSRRSLKSFLQSAAAAKENADDDFTIDQPQAKQVAYESSSGGIMSTLSEMQGKAEDTLSDLRKKEMSANHAFEMVKSGLEQELKHTDDKINIAKSGKATAEEALGKAQGELAVATKTKASDEAYAAELKTDCETKATEWAERQKSAKEEMAVIEKAKEILVGGVKAFVQTGSSMITKKVGKSDDQDEDEKTADHREKLVTLLGNLATKHRSFALNQLASMARSDPFVKIRGLIEDMVAKLIAEAQKEATHEAFCQEEMGKGKKSQDEKQATLDEYQTRIDKASTTIATLTDDVKTLENEIAEIDKANAEATKVRTEEHENYLKASSDFKDSATAVAKAIEVLKTYYQGEFVQISTSSKRQPDFGSAKSDTAHTIISVLEMSEEDFTSLLAEVEATEDQAAKAYEVLMDDNKISKATKLSDAKGKQSEIKSLTVQLEHTKEDHTSTSKELDAVLAYLSKLKPECESKAMSYEEKKAARESEIAGLKEALGILEGNLALVQSRRYLRSTNRV